MCHHSLGNPCLVARPIRPYIVVGRKTIVCNAGLGYVELDSEVICESLPIGLEDPCKLDFGQGEVFVRGREQGTGTEEDEDHLLPHAVADEDASELDATQ